MCRKLSSAGVDECAADADTAAPATRGDTAASATPAMPPVTTTTTSIKNAPVPNAEHSSLGQAAAVTRASSVGAPSPTKFTATPVSLAPASQVLAQPSKGAQPDNKPTSAVTAASSAAVQFGLADLLAKSATTAPVKGSKKKLPKGKAGASAAQASAELSLVKPGTAPAAPRPILSAPTDPADAAILEKASRLRAERRAEEAQSKAAASSAIGASGPADKVDKRTAKLLAAKIRAERLAIKQAQSRAKKAAADALTTAFVDGIVAEAAAAGGQTAVQASAGQNTAGAVIEHKADTAAIAENETEHHVAGRPAAAAQHMCRSDDITAADKTRAVSTMESGTDAAKAAGDTEVGSQATGEPAGDSPTRAPVESADSHALARAESQQASDSAALPDAQEVADPTAADEEAANKAPAVKASADIPAATKPPAHEPAAGHVSKEQALTKPAATQRTGVDSEDQPAAERTAAGPVAAAKVEPADHHAPTGDDTAGHAASDSGNVDAPADQMSTLFTRSDTHTVCKGPFQSFHSVKHLSAAISSVLSRRHSRWKLATEAREQTASPCISICLQCQC